MNLEPQRLRRISLRSCPPAFGLPLDFAAGDAPQLLLDRVLYTDFANQMPFQKRMLSTRFAQVKEEPHRGGGHEAKRVDSVLVNTMIRKHGFPRTGFQIHTGYKNATAEN